MKTMNIDDREGLIVHIEGLQATLTKRNKRIEELERQLVEARNGDLPKSALNRAYKDGWKDCSNRLMNEAQSGITALQRAQSAAFEASRVAEGWSQ